jgi:tetratricopeptide (TPR) repeat protein
MRSRSRFFACLAALVWVNLAATADAGPNSQQQESDRQALPPAPGEGGEQKKLSPSPRTSAVQSRMLDDLFARLQRAPDQSEAQALALAIRHLWFQTRSDTASLLMQRALKSIQESRYPLALSLLDKIVTLEPRWAEAWNQRATARFLADDAEGAMADIDQVMKLEPRHFGALAGMGAILQRDGQDKQALQIYSKSLSIYPLQPDLQKAVEKLKLTVQGRDI